MPVGFYELTGPLKALPKEERGCGQTYLSRANVYVKVDDLPPPYAVANEYISAELAKHIRLPIPPHFLAKIKRTADIAFCSLNATTNGIKLPPVRADQAVVAEPDLCSGVLMFDIWITNDDRHRNNISYQAARNPHKLTIFDHGSAPFRYPDYATRNEGALGVVRPDGYRHCLLDSIATPDYFDKWINRIQEVPREYIAEILADATALGLPDEDRVLGFDFLTRRQQKLGEIVRANKAEFTAIDDWGLLWAT